MKRHAFIYLLFFALTLQVPVSCSKLEVLNKKPDSDLTIPSTLADYISLLEDSHSMNRTPGLGDISSDNCYVLFPYWQTLSATQRNAYLWAENIYESDREIEDWKLPYRQVLNANVVLEGLPKIEVNDANKNIWKQAKGSALFFKGHALYQVAQVFAPCYDNPSADTDMGIPLRPAASTSVKSERATVAQTYQLITDLLKEATTLLGPVNPTQLNLPSRPAALALLARTYLSMHKYDSALAYASQALQNHSTLLDYNSLNLMSSNPFKSYNPEIIFISEMVTSASCMKGITATGTIIDSVLYGSYDSNDLRKQAFFLTNPAGMINSKAGYSGSIYAFTGIAADELYLVKAECEARLGMAGEAMADLNVLLFMRWKSGSFTPFTAGNRNEALAKVLLERRKELPFRGLRWTDLRRLNKEEHPLTLTRKMNNNEYKLFANGNRYVLPIPYDIISMTGMPQNPR